MKAKKPAGAGEPGPKAFQLLKRPPAPKAAEVPTPGRPQRAQTLSPLPTGKRSGETASKGKGGEAGEGKQVKKKNKAKSKAKEKKKKPVEGNAQSDWNMLAFKATGGASPSPRVDPTVRIAPREVKKAPEIRQIQKPLSENDFYFVDDTLALDFTNLRPMISSIPADLFTVVVTLGEPGVRKSSFLNNLCGLSPTSMLMPPFEVKAKPTRGMCLLRARVGSDGLLVLDVTSDSVFGFPCRGRAPPPPTALRVLRNRLRIEGYSGEPTQALLEQWAALVTMTFAASISDILVMMCPPATLEGGGALGAIARHKPKVMKLKQFAALRKPCMKLAANLPASVFLGLAKDPTFAGLTFSEHEACLVELLRTGSGERKRRERKKNAKKKGSDEAKAPDLFFTESGRNDLRDFAANHLGPSPLLSDWCFGGEVSDPEQGQTRDRPEAVESESDGKERGGEAGVNMAILEVLELHKGCEDLASGLLAMRRRDRGVRDAVLPAEWAGEAEALWRFLLSSEQLAAMAYEEWVRVTKGKDMAA